MAKLPQSRNHFFAKTKLSPIGSIWHHILLQTGSLDKIRSDTVEYHRTWTPSHSNCPQLSTTVSDLVESLPDEWRARAKNLFVGRVLGGEVNATAYSHKQAGVVEIDLQYTYAVESYATAFDEFQQATRETIRVATSDMAAETEAVTQQLDQRFHQPWEHIDNSRSLWTDPTVLASWNIDLLKIAAPRQHLIDGVVNASEMFVVAHELGHHLLGHLNTSRPKNKKARSLISKALENECLFIALHGYNPSQKQEIHADILAFLMVARSVDNTPSHPDLYRAIFGSALSLASLAHLSGDWFETDPQATHPPILERLAILQILCEDISAHLPSGEIGDHPLDLFAQLKVFVNIALQDWAAKKWPERLQRPDLLSAISWYLDERKQALSTITSAAKNNKTGEI